MGVIKMLIMPIAIHHNSNNRERINDSYYYCKDGINVIPINEHGRTGYATTINKLDERCLDIIRKQEKEKSDILNYNKCETETGNYFWLCDFKHNQMSTSFGLFITLSICLLFYVVFKADS
jgi:hypothetical protein